MGWLAFVAFMVTFYCLARRAALRLEVLGRGFLFRNFVGWVIGGAVALAQSLFLFAESTLSLLIGLAICAGSVWLYRQPLFPSPSNSAGLDTGTDGG